VEAEAALKMFKLEATPERMMRLTAKAEMGEGGQVAPNWMSMKALREGEEVLRGSIGIYADLTGRAIPVQVVLPPWLLKIASTNPEDIRRRLEEEERIRQAELAEAQQHPYASV
jgi:hypothetical protein